MPLDCAACTSARCSQADGKYFNDMWALDLNTKKWQKIHTYRSPSNRAYHQARSSYSLASPSFPSLLRIPPASPPVPPYHCPVRA